MVDTVSVETSQLASIAVINFQTEGIESSQLSAVTVLSSITPDVLTSAVSLPTVIRTSPPIETSQLAAVVVARGRVQNPSLRAWGFTLDGHDFYVLNLGSDDKTLVFDVSTGQWSHFSTEDNEYWRSRIGLNWKSAGNLGYEYGSNVICGDDSFGILWILNPEQGYDDHPTDSTVSISFPRRATAQMITRGRVFIPVYNVYLTASNGTPSLTGSEVTLSYSDDSGNSFVSAGSIESIAGSYDQEFAWRSLGIIKPPGRLFLVEDDGAFARIDGLDINDGVATA